MNTLSPSNALRKAGFTMMELLMASTLAAIVLSAFITGFVQNRNVFDQKNLEQELQFNVRNAMSFMEEDVVRAGNGLVMGVDKAPDWFNELSGATEIPYIVDGGTGPDRLVTAGIGGSPVATLDHYTPAGSTSISITTTTGNRFEYAPRVGDVLVIGGVEALKVRSVSVFFGNITLGVQSDPFDHSKGLKLHYPAGVEIFLISVVDYAIEELDGVPGLIRDDSVFSYGSQADKRVAEEIVDLQIRRTGNRLFLTLTGRTRGPVQNYTEEADGRPRYTLETEVELRVPEPRLFIGHWPVWAMVATPTPSP